MLETDLDLRGRVEVAVSRGKVVGVLALLAGFAAFGVFIVWLFEGDLRGWVIGGCGFVLAAQAPAYVRLLVSDRPVLTVDREGLRLGPPLLLDLTWDDIEEIELREEGAPSRPSSPHVLIRVRGDRLRAWRAGRPRWRTTLEVLAHLRRPPYVALPKILTVSASELGGWLRVEWLRRRSG